MPLTRKQEQKARNLAVEAARLGHAHSNQVNYTEGSARWQGIATHKDPRKGEYPTEADCSAFVTWCLWSGLHLQFGEADIVNAENWKAGYTGTMLQHGHPVDIKDVRRADAIIYGTRGTTGAHTAIAVTPGPNPLVLSHGSPGVHLLHYNYRPDIIGFRRYIPDKATRAHETKHQHRATEHRPVGHKPDPSKHVAMFDSINLDQIPHDAQAVAGYVGGNWPTFHQIPGRWPHAYHLSIAINASERARCLDIETGDAVAGQAPGWFQRHADHSAGKPVLYTSASNIQNVITTMNRARIGRDRYLIWSAHYTHSEHICAPHGCGYPQADATQFTDNALGRNLDQSICAPGFFA